MNDSIKSEEEKAAEQRRGATSQRGIGSMADRLGRPVERSETFWLSARRLLGQLRQQRVRFTIAVLLAVAGVTFNAVGPLILGQATDYIFAGVISERLSPDTTQEEAVAELRAAGEDRMADLIDAMPYVVPGEGIDFGAVANVALVALTVYAAAALLMWLQNWVLVDAVNAFVFSLRRQAEEKLHRVTLPYLDGQPRGELLSRVTNDIDNVARSLQQTIGQLLTSLVSLISIVALMFVLSWKLAVVALLTIPAAMAATMVIGKRSQRFFVQQWDLTGDVNGVAEEMFSAHELVKVYGRRAEAMKTFETSNRKLRSATFGAQFVSGIIMPSVQFLGNVSYVVIAVLGAIRVATGTMTLGQVQAFMQYSRRFMQPVSQIASMANLLQSGVTSAERVFEFLDAPEQVAEVDDPRVIDNACGHVTFNDVSFAYDQNHPLIESLDLDVSPGQTVAIVGPTGAGKTTLVNLIMRFYELDGGQITLDGVDIAELPRRQLRSRIGMVLQNTWLFAGTIAENIAYGRPDATRDQIVAAAEAAFVDRFAHSLPDGYDTELSDGAGNLSEGEKQLVTIARAFIAEPDLLILDEATSSVDTRTERMIQHALDRLQGGRTSFVIAHRLSTIRDADVIVVMENGRIVEQGSHDDLVDADGAYAKLYAAQFAGEANVA